MDVDPRTGLKIVEVPPDHANYFSSLKDTVTYWFGVVHKFNRVWDQDKRVAIFSDQCIYLCRLDGGITRCVHIRNIDRVLLGESACIGFRINSPDYDMLLQFADLKEREAALSVVKKVYHYLVGSDLVIKQLSEEANTVLQRELNLTKPQGYTVHIEPIRTQKALAKSIADQQRRELEDRKVVEMEFERIKEGLHRELMNHRTEEHDRLVEQLAKYVNELEEKNREIIRLKQDSVSRNDPELWRNCPNCARLQERLSSNSNDDKQKILKLEREIESQHHIMQHLQAAIHHRTTAASQRGDGQNGDGMADSQLVNQLRQELSEANRRNKELQQLIAQSPMLTPEAKQRASRIGTQRDGASFTTSYTSHDWTELVNDKEREVKHLKSVLRDATFRHVQELESIRTQFQRYDEQIVDYLEKVFSGAVQPSGRGGTASQMARATAAAAKNSTAAGLPSVRSVDPYAQLSSIQASPPRAASSYPQYEPQSAQPPQQQFQQQQQQQPRHFEIPSASPQNPLTMQMGGQQPQPQYQDRFGGRGANPGFSPPLEQYSPIQRSFGATPTYTPQRTLY